MNLGDIKRELTHRLQALDMPAQCLSDGHVGSEVAIVGEAPGQSEVFNKSPMVGGSGRILWNSLRRYGISRRDVYTTNVVKKQLLTDGSKRGISAAELSIWADLLRWELSQLPNLKYVLCLGNMAMEVLIGETGITKWRGTVRDTDIEVIEGTSVRRIPVRVLCAYNPAAILRQTELEPMFHFDMFRLNEIIKGDWKEHIVEAHINPTYEEARDYIMDLWLAGEPVAYDIETISGETACIGLANNPNSGMCINFRDKHKNRYTLEQEVELRKLLQEMFADPEMRFIAQNGMFDMTWLWYKDKIRVHRNYFDTMLAHHTLYPSMPHNLGFLTSMYTRMVYYKDEGKTWREGGDIDQFWRYNVKDCCATWAAYRAMVKELKDQNLYNFFMDHVMRLQPHLARMTVGGILMDMGMRDAIAETLRLDVDTLRQKVVDYARIATKDPNLELNPNSTPQLKKLLFGTLGLVGRGTKVDKENRTRIAHNPRTSVACRELLIALDEYKEQQKFLSTYIEFNIDTDGRMRCEYKQTGVQSAPGRLSSSKTMWGSGMNLQNQPQRAQVMFIADPGKVFVYFDLSQAEARVVAWKAKIASWMKQFERARRDSSYDCHIALAADMFDEAYEEIPTYDRDTNGNPTLRFIAKRCRHGLNYRMAADRLATVTGLPLHKALQAYELYHRTTPQLKEWWQDTIEEFRRTGTLFSALGRRLKRLGRVNPDAEDSIIAFYPQSTIGDKVASVIYLAEEDPEWPEGARMILNVHDALIAMCDEDDAELVARIMKKHAEAPLVIDGTELIIPADVKISQPDEAGVHRWTTLEGVTL